MKIEKMLNGHVAVKPDKPEDKSKSGLYIAEQVKTYPPYATVVAVPEGYSDCKVGDRVQYKVYASVDLNDNLAVVPSSGIVMVVA